MGVAIRGEYRWGTGDEPSNSNEVGRMGRWIVGDGAGESHKVNDEVGNTEFVSITGVSEVKGDTNGKTFSTNST